MLFIIAYSFTTTIIINYNKCCRYVSLKWYFYCQVNSTNVSRCVRNFSGGKRDFLADTARYSMQDTPRRRLYLSTAVDLESNFLDRGRRRWVRQGERRNGGGNKRKRKGMPSHRGLSSPTKEDYRICLLVDHHRCRSCLSLLLSLSCPVSSSLLVSSSRPARSLLRPDSFSFYLRNETQWPLCAAQSFDGNFFVKATVTCRAL